MSGVRENQTENSPQSMRTGSLSLFTPTGGEDQLWELMGSSREGQMFTPAPGTGPGAPLASDLCGVFALMSESPHGLCFVTPRLSFPPACGKSCTVKRQAYFSCAVFPRKLTSQISCHVATETSGFLSRFPRVGAPSVSKTPPNAGI